MRMLHVPNSYDDLDMDEDEFKAFRREGTKRERGGERERARAREREREKEGNESSYCGECIHV